MKDNIILGLWIIYSQTIGTLTVVYAGQEDKLEAFGLGVLAAQLILSGYLLLVGGFNTLIGKFKLRIKLSPPKRFKNKVSPIYKLTVWEGTKNCFSIGKYELQWIDFYESYRFWLVPFITLFQRYKYVPVDFFYEFEMDLDKVEDIGLLWEMEFTKRHRKESELKSAAQKELEKVNKLNKVFLENYEK